MPPTSSVLQHPQSIIIFSQHTGVNGTALQGEAIRTLAHAEPKELKASNTKDEYNLKKKKIQSVDYFPPTASFLP